MHRKTDYIKKWIDLRLRKYLIHPVAGRFYHDSSPEYRQSIMIAGAGRSGTTWIANMISSQLSSRLMNEPFHSRYIKEFSRFQYFHYMRPDEENPELLAYCQKVFSGSLRHPWVDHEVEHLYPKYRLIKEIRANLFLKWIANRFPEVPILFVIRNPCAVVVSRIQLGWATDGDITPFLQQPELMNDFLQDKIEVIQEAKTDEEKHAVVWSINNLIPLMQFNDTGLNIIFYENLYDQPEVEIEHIFQTIGHKYQDSVYKTFNRPSRSATSSSAVMSGNNIVTQWKSKLSQEQASKILSIVDKFGLGYLYGDSSRPLLTDLFKDKYAKN